MKFVLIAIVSLLYAVHVRCQVQFEWTSEEFKGKVKSVEETLLHKYARDEKKPWSKTTTFYDSEGRITRSILQFYYQDSWGGGIHTDYWYSSGKLAGFKEYQPGNDTDFREHVIVKWSSNGREATATYKNEKNEIQYIYVHKFDGAGKEFEMTVGPDKPPLITKFVYDNAGRKTAENSNTSERPNGATRPEKQTFFYGVDNLPLVCKGFSDGMTMVQRWEYNKFDDHGNWTNRTESIDIGGTSFTERKFIYYE